MKPLHLLLLLFTTQILSAQSLDYLSVQKKNGRSIKNIYAGTRVLLQTTDGSFVEGPVETVRQDSLFIRTYDIRFYRTAIGSVYRDTVSTALIGLHHKEVARVQLTRKRNFLSRTVGPLLMIGGGMTLALNLVNGAFFKESLTSDQNLRTLARAGGAIGIGYLLSRLFWGDGFSTKRHRLVYVKLSGR